MLNGVEDLTPGTRGETKSPYNVVRDYEAKQELSCLNSTNKGYNHTIMHIYAKDRGVLS